LLSAPIDFKKKSPELQEIELKIAVNNSAPYPGDQIEVNITAKNIGDYDIGKYDLYWFNTLKTLLPTIEGDYTENNLLEINSIGTNISKSIQIIVNKTNFMGYLLMIPHFLASILNNPTISIRSSSQDPLIVGEISFQIEKIVSNTIVFQGDLITILVKVNNTGTIPFGNFSLQERTTISSSDFQYLGNESYFIGILDPNEVKNFTINLIPKQWIGNSQISESTLPLYTPYYTEFVSNELTFTNLINKFFLILMIIVPIGIVAVVLIKRFILNPRKEIIE